MNKNSDESWKKGAKESGKDNASKSDKKDDDSEEKQVSGKKKTKRSQSQNKCGDEGGLKKNENRGTSVPKVAELI